MMKLCSTGLPCGSDGELFQQRPYVQPYNADVGKTSSSAEPA